MGVGCYCNTHVVRGVSASTIYGVIRKMLLFCEQIESHQFDVFFLSGFTPKLVGGDVDFLVAVLYNLVEKAGILSNERIGDNFCIA